MPLYDVTLMARAWLCSRGGTAKVPTSLVPATYICDCAPRALVISRLNNRAENVVATLIPMACSVGGAKPDNVTMVLASTRLAAVGFDSVACAICDSRTTALPSPTGRSTRNGVTSLIVWPGPGVSISTSAYTDSGAMARTVAVGDTASPRDSSQLPSAPVTTASTTSLMSQS